MALLRLVRNPLAYPAGVAPGFDPTHVAAVGTQLSGVVLAGNFINFLSGVPGTAILAPPSSIITIGPSLTYTASNKITEFASPNGTTAYTALTWGAILQITTINTSNGAVIIGLHGSSSFGQFGYVVTTGVLQVVPNGTGVNTSSPFPVLSTNTPYFCAASIANNTVSNKANFVLINLLTGQVYSQQVTHATTISAGDGTVYLGNRSSANRQIGGYLSHVMFTGNYCSMQQLLQWAADPWSFWYPHRKIDNFAVGSSISPFTWMQGDEESIHPMSHFRREMVAHD